MKLTAMSEKAVLCTKLDIEVFIGVYKFSYLVSNTFL